MEFSKNFWGKKFWNKKEAFFFEFFLKEGVLSEKKKKGFASTKLFVSNKNKLFVFTENK